MSGHLKLFKNLSESWSMFRAMEPVEKIRTNRQKLLGPVGVDARGNHEMREILLLQPLFMMCTARPLSSF